MFAKLTKLLVLGVLPASFASAQSGAPSYTGEVCFDGSNTVINVTATPTATAILIYPSPPGGGYFMQDPDGDGTYTHTISGLASGTNLNFHLVIQVPQQYEFDAHSITLASGCESFAFGSPDPDPDPDPEPDPDPDPEPDPNGPLPPRGISHDILTDGASPRIWLKVGPGGSGVAGVSGVEAHYRVNGGVMVTETMSALGGYQWSVTPLGVALGDTIEYSFTEQVGGVSVDTDWFTRVVGEAKPEGPTYPLQFTSAARFRDRHENEWRFDHYVPGYEAGRIFEFEITDHGHSLDVALTPDPGFAVPAADLKWFIGTEPNGFCDRILTVIGVRMNYSGGIHTYTIPNVTPGQVVEFEFTLLGSQTYYSEYFYYAVGSGKLRPRYSHPWAYAAGDASVSAVTVKQFAFNQHALNLTPAELREFLDGKQIFETRYDNGLLFNPPTAFDCNGGPVGFNMGQSNAFKGGALGPQYSNVSCIECHMLDGRGAVPELSTDPLDDIVVRIGVPDGSGGFEPHPVYGRQLDQRSTPGEPIEGTASITWQTECGQFDDGTPYELRRPVVGFSGMAHGGLGSETEVSLRVAPMLAGLGLLEAVTDETIVEWHDPNDADGDGISGRANVVADIESGALAIGRFGWKATQPTLRQQTASAFHVDMGMTNPLFATHDCADTTAGCSPAVDDSTPELTNGELDAVATYLQGLAVPPRENYQDPQAIQGKALFEAANCQACHRATMTTGFDHPIAGYHGQTIQPFTDMLLHDMGPDLADGLAEDGASGSEWRTPPLWGIGYVGNVLNTPTDPFDPNGEVGGANFLHDGRARTLMEAILWHGGEAQASKEAVLAMSGAERDALIEYVKFPFADPPAGAAPACDGDANSDGFVNVNDVSHVLFRLGDPNPITIIQGDANGDGAVDVNDISYVLFRLGNPC